MVKNIFTIGLFSSLAIFGIAQEDDNNLVDNPSFEVADKVKKLNKLKKIEVANGWSSPTAMKADLYSTQAKEVATIPNNGQGREFPMGAEEGNYAGIVAYSYNNKEPRTYLQTELIGPLKKDVEYCVKYHVSLSDLSKYGVNNLGMYIAKDPIEIETKEDIIFQKEKELARVVIPQNNEVKMARYGFEPICGVYKASGKERFIIIGNFKNNKDTKYEKLKKKADIKGSQFPKAYYYVDQVEVFVLENPEDCDCSQKQKTNNGESVIYHKQFTSEDAFTIEQQIKFSTIYFDNLKAEIDPIMITDLDNLVKVLKENSAVKIEINAHADKTEVVAASKEPDNEKWQKLDEKRAEKIKAYLVEKGVDAGRLTVKNHGSLRAASEGAGEIDKAKNRRVEFVIIK
ncbi:MAG: OmpA family protein [Flavobacteriales bacterium]|jgi:outer membrane protein OmpA-like peptidoglycan-associated protein|nr:OmpA family protein [Flavobacteriales bacterium]